MCGVPAWVYLSQQVDPVVDIGMLGGSDAVAFGFGQVIRLAVAGGGSLTAALGDTSAVATYVIDPPLQLARNAARTKRSGL